MSGSTWKRDFVLWIAVFSWLIWFVSMWNIAGGAGSVSHWLALDAVAQSGSEIALVGHVPLDDGQQARLASSAPGWALPEPVEVQHGHAHFTAEAPAVAGIYTWSVLPPEGQEAAAVSVGSFAVLVPGDAWIGIDIDEILADAPWQKMQTSNPPRPYPKAHRYMLDLSRHGLLVCWSSIDTQQLPLLRQWWSRQGLPSSILLTEEEPGGALRHARKQLGDPVVCLAGVNAISSLGAGAELEVIGVAADNGAGWETALQRLEQLENIGK
jgi:hypothetical protein